MLTYELLTGASPFTVEGERNTQQEISRRILKTEPPIPGHLSTSVRSFISSLLVKDPRQRLGGGPRDAKELKEHSFFKNASPSFSWSALESRRITPPFVPRIAHELDTSNFSDEFTKMVAADSPAVVPPNYDKLFRGYSYVAPSILFAENVVSEDIFRNEGPVLHQRPSASDVLAARFEESTFFKNYELDPRKDALGDGSFSVCRRCRHRRSQKEFAVKIVSRRVDCGREANLLKTCQGHPNVVKLIEVHQDRAHTYLVMELLEGGELMRKSRPFSEVQASRIMRQLASAVRFMHSRGVVHRDLKPENIVFTNAGDDSTIKVVDFGFARIRRGREPLHTPCFTLPYAAPEVLARQGYDESCDLWSLGAILYSMLSGRPPFRAGSPDFASRVKAGDIDFDGEVWRGVSASAKEVARGLLTADPNKRLTASELANHEWVVGSAAPPLTPLPENSATSSSTVETSERGGFRLKNVDGAGLAKRRKLQKRSTSSSVSSSASNASSSLSVQLLRPPSATATAVSASPAQPSAFDFGEERVNEYLSSLSSSSDSNSPRIATKTERTEQGGGPRAKRRKRDADDGTKPQADGSGPVTRARKRKLEQNTSSSDSSFESSETTTRPGKRDPIVHRKQRTGKRPKRLTTIIVE